MKRGFGVAIVLLAVVCCTNSLAAGILKLSRTEMTIAPDKPPGALWVENKGDTPLYLDVTQQWVANPGNTPERLMPVGEVEQPELLVFPNRLALAPGQKYRMTLKVLRTPREWKVWRITFRQRERIMIDVEGMERMPTPLFISVGYGVAIYQQSGKREGATGDATYRH
ncbi:hypothetical protein [Burkholderia orbicola]|uniref:Pilus assembly protein n=1 Tax=Burkholderia orbicola TaxID=2978683 RepID=A0ABT8NXP9_9BURK|nr:hypothetical protein [Burkholderia orbicola]MDN7526348.1 hypothetical protein [Burkholderia orbicola]